MPAMARPANWGMGGESWQRPRPEGSFLGWWRPVFNLVDERGRLYYFDGGIAGSSYLKAVDVVCCHTSGCIEAQQQRVEAWPLHPPLRIIA